MGVNGGRRKRCWEERERERCKNECVLRVGDKGEGGGGGGGEM